MGGAQEYNRKVPGCYGANWSDDNTCRDCKLFLRCCADTTQSYERRLEDAKQRVEQITTNLEGSRSVLKALEEVSDT